VARPLTPAAPRLPAPRLPAPRLPAPGLALPRLAIAGLAALTLVRLVVAATLPLSPDEAYYWVWSRALAAGYLDHPPMVAFWARAGTLVAGDGALGIRLLAPLAAALGSWLLWQAAENLLPGRGAGLVAAALLNATLLLGAGAVTMTPDTPLLFFWVCTLWALARLRTPGIDNATRNRTEIVTDTGAEGDAGAWWLAVGLFAGLALDSKYTAAFLVLGIGLWLLLAERRWLTRPWPWLGLLVSLLVVAPVLAWNAAHGWASFAKQGARIDAWRPARAAQFLGELIVGQLGLATPLVLLLCVAGLALACRRAWQREPGWTLLVALSLPAVVVFVEHAFADRVQGNWPAIVYPSAVIAAAGLEAPRWHRLYRPAVVLGLAMTAAVYVQATLALLPVPVRFDPSALQLAGWPELAAQVEAARRREGASFVATDQYGVASELAYLLPADVPVAGIEQRWRMFDLSATALDGRVGILVRSARREALSGNGPWAARDPLGMVARQRDGQTVELYRLYRIVGGSASLDATVLPRR
jgi:4-amino-4-deoxy-L-arabinose transferase-like glycosyltransferase